MSSRSDGAARTEPRRHHPLLKWGLGGFAAIIILAASATGLFRVAANLVPRYHGLIESQVAAQLGMPVSLGRISLAWHGLGPALVLRRVRVLAADGKKEVFSARSIRLEFGLLALFHGADARPDGVVVDAPRLSVARKPDGSLYVPGFSPSAAGAPAPDVSAFLGMHFAIHGGSLRLLPAETGSAAWVFTPLELEVGGGRKHTVALSVGLPSELGGGQMRLGGTLATPGPSPEHWQWNGRYYLPDVPLAPLSQFVPAGYPAVHGTLSSQGEFAGTGAALENASGDLQARDLAAGKSRVPRLQTRYEVAGGTGIGVTLKDTHIVEPGRAWDPGVVSFGRDAAGRLHAALGDIALAALPPLAGFVPARFAAYSGRLEEMQPVGEVKDVRFAMTPGEPGVDFSARLSDVGVQHAAGAPGFQHLSGVAAISGGSGEFDLDAPGFTLLMPHIFDHPVRLDRVAGRIGIGIDATGLHLAAQKMTVTGPAGLAGVAEWEIGIPRSGPVTISLSATGDPVAVNPARALYLPTGLLPKELDDWLMQGFDGGRVSGAKVEISGAVDRFPFKKGGGRFSVTFDYAGVTLKPGPDWEPLTDLDGSVEFLNAGLSAKVSGGRIGKARVVEATARMPDFFSPELHVDATVAGDAGDFLKFLNASPVGGRLPAEIDRLSMSGPASTVVAIDIPVLHLSDFSVNGKLRLNNATLRYGGFPAPLNKLAGTVAFDAKGPTSGTLDGSLLGSPLKIALSRSADRRSTRLEFTGTLPVATLSRLAGGDLSSYARGSLPLDVQLSVPLSPAGPGPTLDARSDLKGLALEFPAPVGKTAQSTVPLAAHAEIDSTGVNAMIHYGDVLSICGRVATAGKRPALHAGNVVLGAGSCAAPAAGLLVSGGWSRLDLQAWLAKLSSHAGGAGTSGANLGALDIDLHFAEVDAFTQRFPDLSAKGTLGPKALTLEVDGPDLAGSATIPRKPTNEDPIVAELTRGRFELPRSHAVVVAPASAATPATVSAPAPARTTATAGAAVSAPAPAGTAVAAAPVASTRSAPAKSHLRPDDIPPFKLHAAHLELGSAPLNDVTIDARQAPSGLIVDPIRVGGGALDLKGTLVWIEVQPGQAQGALHIVGSVDGLGKLLTGLGLGPVITGHGAFSAGLAWNNLSAGGSFTDHLLGRVSVDLRDGSISQVNPGAGRLLSLLNLANIPRYLVFNFHNLFGKGFPFSRIHGDYVIDHGTAHTKGLFIDSSIAAIKLTGSIDLAHETIDQEAEIVPNYTGSLPIIGALFGGLPVGAVVFAITKIFGNPIAQATKIEYTITGPLNQPVVKPRGATPAPKVGTHVRPAPAATAGGGR